MDKKLFIALYTPEALSDLSMLDRQNQKRVYRAVGLFEQLGTDAGNSRPLNKDGLFELKADKVRIYFKYYEEKIIIVGLITLKKTQKAPERYKTQAVVSINRYIKSKNKE